MRIRIYNAKIMIPKGMIQGEIWVEDGIITHISNVGSLVELHWDRVIDACGNLIMPSFKNAHAHSPMTFLRSFADDLPLEEWLFNKVFPNEAKLTYDDCYWLTKLAILEYLSSGISVASDMYFHLEAIANACVDCGFRNVIMEGITQSNYDNLFKRLDEGKSKLDGLGGLIEYRLGLHAEYTNGIENLQLLSQYVKANSMPLYVHLSETKKEVDGCLQKYNLTPTELMDSLGLWDFGGTAYHCVHMTKNDIQIFSKRKLNIVTCPASNLKLASGIAPIYDFQKAGINIALGTDGPASNNCLDMFREMFLVTGLQKVMQNDAQAIDAMSVLEMATTNGAKAMQVANLDSLQVGKSADIIMIDLNMPNMQPINNILKNIVYAGNKSNVKMTMVAGKILYEDGKYYINESIDKIYSQCNSIAKRVKNV